MLNTLDQYILTIKLYPLLSAAVVIAAIVTILYIAYLVSILRARFVPFVKTNPRAIEILSRELKLKSGDTFIELGCGDGLILELVTEKFNGIKAWGYEIAPYAFLKAKIKQRKNNNKYQVFGSSFMKADLSQANVIYCFLLPLFMNSAWRKIKRECQSGTLVYSYAFHISEATPIKIIPIPHKKSSKKKPSNLYIYEV